MAAVFFQGFLLNAGLIVAIGTQNAFVIVQGLRRRFVFAVVMICALCGRTYRRRFVACQTCQCRGKNRGVEFCRNGFFAVVWCDLLCAYRGESLNADGDNGGGLARVIITALAFSLLNPHAILDMAVIFGGVAAGLESDCAAVCGARAASRYLRKRC